MNASPQTTAPAAKEPGASAIGLIDNLHACLHAAAAVASLLDLAFEIQEVNARNGILCPRAEEIPVPSALVATRAVRAIDMLLNGAKEDATQLFEQARRVPQAKLSQ